MHFVLKVAGFLTLFVAPLAAEPITLCYREDAAPFSFVADDGTPKGYSVDLCRRAVAGQSDVAPEMVLVTAETRFDALISGQCRLLCEATTVTMQRRRDMEFSLITFLTGSAFLFPKSLLEPGDGDAAEIRVGFLENTTAHENWKSGNLVGGSAFSFTFEAVEDHEAAATRLADGTLSGYVADREILEGMLAEDKDLAERYQVGRTSLSYEPYALAVAKGDDDLRIAVDEVLAELFRSGEVREILGAYIPQRRFDPILDDLFELQSLPE